jgi:hypothetical protein
MFSLYLSMAFDHVSPELFSACHHDDDPIDEKQSRSPSLQRSVLSVVNDLQRTYIQIKKLQVPWEQTGIPVWKLADSL